MGYPWEPPYGPDFPRMGDLVAAREAELEALTTPWVSYEEYERLCAARQQTAEAFLTGAVHRIAAGGAAREAEAG